MANSVTMGVSVDVGYVAYKRISRKASFGHCRLGAQAGHLEESAREPGLKAVIGVTITSY